MAKISANKIRAAFARDEVLCQTCNTPLHLQGLEKFTTVKCPKCGKNVFVPGAVAHYVLFDLLGEGGMGSVFKACDLKTDDQNFVALKLMSREAQESPADIMALLNEARVASRFNDSEFIAGCLEHGYSGGEYYTVSPFIDGERIDKRIQRLGKLKETDVLKLALHILAAEQHIYRGGFLFRDLKPENVIINSKGYAILFDFGLCIPVEQAANPSGDAFVAGSPYYIPPERLLNEPENAASEIYSLGMLMYYCLTGQNYFNADEIDALAKRHVSGLRISNTGKMSGIIPSIATLLDLMIRQENQERPQDFGSVADAIKDILHELA